MSFVVTMDTSYCFIQNSHTYTPFRRRKRSCCESI